MSSSLRFAAAAALLFAIVALSAPVQSVAAGELHWNTALVAGYNFNGNNDGAIASSSLPITATCTRINATNYLAGYTVEITPSSAPGAVSLKNFAPSPYHLHRCDMLSEENHKSFFIS